MIIHLHFQYLSLKCIRLFVIAFKFQRMQTFTVCGVRIFSVQNSNGFLCSICHLLCLANAAHKTTTTNYLLRIKFNAYSLRLCVAFLVVKFLFVLDTLCACVFSYARVLCAQHQLKTVYRLTSLCLRATLKICMHCTNHSLFAMKQ